MQVQVRSLNYTLYIFLLDELFFYVEKVWNLKHKKLLHSKQMQENKKLENLVKLFGMQEVNSRTRGGVNHNRSLSEPQSPNFLADIGDDAARFLNRVEKNFVLHT